MSILVNLLPDVRQAKLRERRRRQLVSGLTLTIWVICGAVVLLLFLYNAGQKVIAANLTSQIAKKESDLKNVPGLTDALTAQQHASSLSGLYDQRVYMSKFFAAFGEANPQEVSLTSLTMDTQNLLTINGYGRTYASVAKLARAMEASNVKVGTNAAETNTPYFSAVTISSISNSATKGINFTLSATLSSGATNGVK